MTKLFASLLAAFTLSASAANVSMPVPGAQGPTARMESVPHQARTGLLLQDKVRRDFDALKATIQAGGQ